MPCQPFRSSMKETPLPLIVLARMTVGSPFFPIPASASRIFPVLWPSTTTASHPNARNLRA